MTAGKFFGVIFGALLAAVLLTWTFVSAVAVVYALTEGDSGAAGTYVVSTLVGLLLCVLAVWVLLRVARTRRERH